MTWLFLGITVIMLRQGIFAQPISVQGRFDNCSSVAIPSQFLKAYVSWPYTIPCSLIQKVNDNELLDIIYEDDYGGELLLLCELWSESGDLLFNETFLYDELQDRDDISYSLGDLQENSSVDFLMIVYAPTFSKCWSSNIHINLEPLQPTSCEEFMNHSTDLIPHKASTPRTISCTVDDSIYPKLYPNHNQVFQWRRNCSSLPEKVEINQNNQLVVGSVDFDHAGIYVCSVTYNGMTRYIVQTPLCVLNPLSANIPSFTCEKSKLLASPGETATFSCLGNLGKGAFDRTSFNLKWKKVLPSGKSTDSEGCSEHASNSPVSCHYNFVRNECYLHIANEQERKKTDGTVHVFLKISNLTTLDYGTYVLEFVRKLDGLSSVNVTLSLDRDQVPVLLTIAGICGICIGLVFFSLFCLLLIKYNLRLVRVYLKRYYGAYTKENKKYGAYLIYTFSQDIDAFTQKDTRGSVIMVREMLEEMGYRVYDERRDGFDQESRAENISNRIETSHRIIVLLSLEFIKDGWSMLALQKGFDEMIKSKSRLIFILLPGMKEYLKQHQHTDESCLMIRRAVKLNYSIQWKNKDNFSRKAFRLRLEDAMPKLKSQKLSRVMSNSTTDGYDHHSYQRGVSNETQVQNIDSLSFSSEAAGSDSNKQADNEDTFL